MGNYLILKKQDGLRQNDILKSRMLPETDNQIIYYKSVM